MSAKLTSLCGEKIEFSLESKREIYAKINATGVAGRNCGEKAEALLKSRVFGQYPSASKQGVPDIMVGKQEFEVKLFNNNCSANFKQCNQALAWCQKTDNIIYLFIIGGKVFSMKGNDYRNLLRFEIQRILTTETKNYGIYFISDKNKGMVQQQRLMLKATNKCLRFYEPYLTYEDNMTKLLGLV